MTVPVPKFVSIGALASELICVSDSGQLHQWRWDSDFAFADESVNRAQIPYFFSSLCLSIPPSYSNFIHVGFSSRFLDLILCHQPMINQSINQSNDQSINQSTKRMANQSINQSNGQSINQSIERMTNQSINRANERSINESILGILFSIHVLSLFSFYFHSIIHCENILF